jgi:hypothetical protein
MSSALPPDAGGGSRIFARRPTAICGVSEVDLQFNETLWQEVVWPAQPRGRGEGDCLIRSGSQLWARGLERLRRHRVLHAQPSWRVPKIAGEEGRWARGLRDSGQQTAAPWLDDHPRWVLKTVRCAVGNHLPINSGGS